MKLRAFNIIPGLVIQAPANLPGPSDQVAVITAVERNSDLELVHISARVMPVDYPIMTALDYNSTVNVVGVSVHPEDTDDTDFGTAHTEYVRQQYLELVLDHLAEVG